MQKTYDVVTALDICVDFMIYLGDTELEFGQKEKLINGYSMEMGGSACIFACQCAKLGLAATGPGTIGQDNMGELAINTMASYGVDISYIKKNAYGATALGAALAKANGDRSILTYMGLMDTVDGELLNRLLPKTRHLHVCSFYLLKGLQGVYREILPKAKKLGITISLDTNWDPEETWDGGIRELLPYVDIFLPNENELLYITGQSNTDDALKYACERVPTVVVKCGEKGAYAYHQGRKYECGALKVDIADTVGAGDSLNGGFVYGFLAGMPIEKCLKAGTVCGSLSTRLPGGSQAQPKLDEVLGYL